MGIFDKIKFKKGDKGTLEEKTEKVEDSLNEQRANHDEEVKKATKILKEKNKDVKENASQVKLRKEDGVSTRHVVIKPIVTEKAAYLSAQSKYVFEVEPTANRIEVKNAIKNMYGIIPVSVNIQNISGKKVRFGRRRGTRKNWKKAIITLPKGKSIDVYTGV